MLSSEFANIRKELENQKNTLEESRKTKKLTKTEADLFGVLLAALKTSESRVQKEIVDVEELVD